MKSEHLRLLLSLFAVVLVMGLGACSDDDDVVGPTEVNEFAELTKVGDAYFTNYTPASGNMNPDAQTVYDNIYLDGDDTNDYFIVDWRSATHYANGHIQGAINMSLGEIIDRLDEFPTDGTTILNVCYSGQTASNATAILGLLGYDAANLKFGMHGWTYQGNTDLLGTTGANYPMSDDWADVFEQTNNDKPAAGDYPTLDTGKTTAVDIIKARADDYVKGNLNNLGTGWNRISNDGMWDEFEVNGNGDDWHILNYFPQANYDAGHMRGAIRYQPKSDLSTETFLNTLPLPTDKKILVYCWTGQTSAQVTAYLNILGYEAYSGLYGVQDMVYNNGTINDHAFQPITDPQDAFPVVSDVDEFEALAALGDDYFTSYVRTDGGLINVEAQPVYDNIIDGDDTNDYFIVDWRSSTHYGNGHITGAINMSLGSIIDEIDTFPTDGTVILNVCYSGQTASNATAILNMLGYSAANLKFGMHSWTYQGNTDLLGDGANYPMDDDWAGAFETIMNPKPVAGAYPTLDTGEFTAEAILRARANDYVTGNLNNVGTGWNRISDDDVWDELYINGNAEDWFILNYFPTVNYDAGHMEGAVRYQPKADLQTTTSLNTLPTNKKILVYCWTGQTSAQVTAYLNMLGYEAYSCLYGVQDMVYSNTIINDHAFVGITDPLDAYPVVTD